MHLDSMRRAFRSLRRAPALTLISVVTVALGVGAGTALFSVVKAVLLNPLPFPEPNRLAYIAEVNDSGRQMQVPSANFEDWQRENRSFVVMTASGEGPVNAGGGESPERTYGAYVMQDFFRVMGIQPAMGRGFEPAEQKFRAAGTVVLGDGLWRRAYGGDSRVLCKKNKFVGPPLPEIGVMPPGVSYTKNAGGWV